MIVDAVLADARTTLMVAVGEAENADTRLQIEAFDVEPHAGGFVAWVAYRISGMEARPSARFIEDTPGLAAWRCAAWIARAAQW